MNAERREQHAVGQRDRREREAERDVKIEGEN